MSCWEKVAVGVTSVGRLRVRLLEERLHCDSPFLAAVTTWQLVTPALSFSVPRMNMMTLWSTGVGARSGSLPLRHPNPLPMTPTLPDLSSNINIISNLIKIRPDNQCRLLLPSCLLLVPPTKAKCEPVWFALCFIH